MSGFALNVAGGVGLNGFGGLGVTGFGGLSFTPFSLLSGLTFDRPGTANLSFNHSPSACTRSASHSWKVFMPYGGVGPSLLVRA